MIMRLTAFFRSGILLLREFRGGTVSVPDLRRKEKHMKKRIFSFLLAVLMLAALLPTAAFADESEGRARSAEPDILHAQGRPGHGR